MLAASSVVVDRLRRCSPNDADAGRQRRRDPGRRRARDGRRRSSRHASIAASAASAARRSSRVRRSCSFCCARWRADRRRARCATWCWTTLGAMAHGRHARPPRRRLPPLFGRRALARAALREDALRPGAARARASEAAQAAGIRCCADVADDTLAYVDRDLSDPGGGFYSAEDADSIPPEPAGTPGAHASEGAFYIWPQHEVETLLGEADARDRALRFGLEPGGNAPFDPQQEFTGKNLLYTAATFEDIAARVGRPVDDVSTWSPVPGRCCSRRGIAARVRRSTTRC